MNTRQLWRAYDHICAAQTALGNFYDPADIDEGEPHPFDADELIQAHGRLRDAEIAILKRIRARGDTTSAIGRRGIA